MLAESPPTQLSESKWERFKEIRPEEITAAIFCLKFLSNECAAVIYSLDREFEYRAKAISPRMYVYFLGGLEIIRSTSPDLIIWES
jgi:hypothetical protein